MSDDNVSLKSESKAAKDKKKRIVGLALLGIVAITIIGVATHEKPKVEFQPTWSVPEPLDTQDAVLTKMRGEVSGVTKAIEELRNENKKQKESSLLEIEKLKAELIELKKNEVLGAGSAEKKVKTTNVIGDSAPAGAKFEEYKLPSVNDRSAIVKKAAPEPPPLNRAYVKSTPKVASYRAVDEVDSLNDSDVMDFSKGIQDDAYVMKNDVITAKKKLRKNPMAGFIPATSAVKIALTTGLDAIASGAARGNPEPVHFRIQDDAFLAGDAKYRLSGCMGQATGYGDLSTTRAKLKATRLVCIDTEENVLLESEISGWISDSDGQLGMRGIVRNREGQIAGKAFVASFVEGATAIIAASGTEITGASGIATQSVSTADAFRTGFAGGSSKASSMLSERYIEQMEQIAPTIEVLKGRRGTLHFLEGTQLVWKEYQGAYYEEILPDSSN